MIKWIIFGLLKLPAEPAALILVDYDVCIYAVIILGAYFLFFRPNSKKRKKEEANRKDAKIGDEITTIGGICGRIVGIKMKPIPLLLRPVPTAARLRIKRWAISVETPLDRVQQAATESSENKPAEKKGLLVRKGESRTRNKRRKIIFSFFVHHKISFV
ncbi:MAG: preprotein translocase subunit YajC [Acutalibacteraceae bacterium]